MNFQRLVFFVGLTAAIAVSGCVVINPYAEYRKQYEKLPIGRLFTDYFPNRGPPLRVEMSASGNEVHVYDFKGVKRQCIQFFELQNGIIIRAWHEGHECAIVN
jgi:hypothetical protein